MSKEILKDRSKTEENLKKKSYVLFLISLSSCIILHGSDLWHILHGLELDGENRDCYEFKIYK